MGLNITNLWSPSEVLTVAAKQVTRIADIECADDLA